MTEDQVNLEAYRPYLRTVLFVIDYGERRRVFTLPDLRTPLSSHYCPERERTSDFCLDTLEPPPQGDTNNGW